MDYYEYTSPSYTTTSTASSEIGAVAIIIMLIVVLKPSNFGVNVGCNVACLY